MRVHFMALAALLVACGGSTENGGSGGKDAGAGGGSGGVTSGGNGGTAPSGGKGGTTPGGGGMPPTGGGGASGAGALGGMGGVGATGGVAGAGGVVGASCAGNSYCDCTANQACQVLSEACFCPCGVEPCEPNCACGCGGGKYLGCAPTSITNPGALDGVWLIGWMGGLNHFSWARFEQNGVAWFNDGQSLTANAPYWPCSGQGSWTITQKPETIQILLPASCNPGMTVLTFTGWSGVSGYPYGALLQASVETNPSSSPLVAYAFPAGQCDATLTSCTDPL